jgi:CheY-like chemotaxis protein
MPSILLIAQESAAAPLAEALRNELGAQVETATGAREAIAASLKQRHFELVLIDEGLTFTAEQVHQVAGSATLLELNVGISSATRIVRQVRAALSRRNHMLAEARTAATHSLREELNGTLAGLLLESQLALRHSSPENAPHLQHLVELAGELRTILQN